MAKATGKSTPAKRAGTAKKAPSAPAVKRVGAKKIAAKKAATKKAAKAPAAKKPIPKKAAVSKAPAKKAAKAPAKKAAKPPAKKLPAKKAVAKKAPKPAKKAPAKKAPAKKAPPKPKVPKPPKPPKGKTCPLSGIFVPTQSPNVSPKTLEKLKEQLIEERERHLRQAADLQADADSLVAEREQGDTQFDEESGEGDTISVERERDLMLSANAGQAVEEIDRALERMAAGRYGLCVPAGRRIPVARLEAIPWAESCVDCKQRVERRR